MEGSSCKQVHVGPTFLLPAGAPGEGKALGVAHLMLSLLFRAPLLSQFTPRASASAFSTSLRVLQAAPFSSLTGNLFSLLSLVVFIYKKAEPDGNETVLSDWTIFLASVGQTNIQYAEKGNNITSELQAIHHLATEGRGSSLAGMKAPLMPARPKQTCRSTGRGGGFLNVSFSW